MARTSKTSDIVSIPMTSCLPDQQTFLTSARKGQKEDDQYVNKTNKYGDTELITATRSGLVGAIKALIKRGADITHRNNEGDDVFQVAVNQKDLAVLEILVSSVKDESTDPGWSDRVHPLLRRALHEAARHGSCEKISVLVSVDSNLDLQDENGNTFLHTAAEQNQPEVISTFSTKFDVNMQNNNGDSPLHIACQQVAHEAILSLLKERANPGIQNKDGDSALHCLINALNSVPDRPEKHEEVIINLLEKWIEWWSLDQSNVTKNGEHIEYRVKAFEYLRETLVNEANASVFTLAFKNGCVPVIKVLLTMKNATCFTQKLVTQHIVTDLAPKVQKTSSTISYLELLLENNTDPTIEEVLNLEPVKEFEVMYNTMTSVIYLILLLLHVLYMSVLSYSATAIMDSLRTNSSEVSSDVAITFYFTAPLEPACVVLTLIYKIQCSQTKCNYSRDHMFSTFVLQCFSIIHHLMYLVLIVVLLSQYHNDDRYNMHNTLSVTLLFGWLTTLSFTQGLKPLRFFWKMTLKMIVVDVYKMLFVYIFILIGFTFALYVQFQVSEEVIATYRNPMYTMFLVFRLMLGMGTLIEDDTLTEIHQAGGSKSLPIVLFVLYLVLATVVLLNLLIAMMNTSYSDILTKMRTTRRVASLQLGFNLERMLPSWTNKLISNVASCGSISTKGQYLEKDDQETDSSLWYVEVERPKSVNHLEQSVTERIALLETEIKKQLAQINAKLDAKK